MRNVTRERALHPKAITTIFFNTVWDINLDSHARFPISIEEIIKTKRISPPIDGHRKLIGSLGQSCLEMWGNSLQKLLELEKMI